MSENNNPISKDDLLALLTGGGAFDANPDINVQELEDTVAAQKDMLGRWESTLGSDKQVQLESVAYAFYANEGDISHLTDEIAFLKEEVSDPSKAASDETVTKVQAVLDWQLEARGRLKALLHTLSAPQAN